MFSTTLSATTWYADVALIVLLVGFTAFGAVRGFGKSMKGFFMTVTVVFISLLLMGLLHNTVLESSIGQSLMTALGEKSAGWGPEFNEIIHIDESNVKYILVDGARQNLAEFSFKGLIADKVADVLITDYGLQSLAGLCIRNISSLIISVCLFAISCIVLSILCSIIKGFTQGMHESSSKRVRTVDRILGAIVGLILGAVTIMIVFAVLQVVGDKVPEVIEYINQSVICKFFFDLNPIGQVLASIFSKQ